MQTPAETTRDARRQIGEPDAAPRANEKTTDERLRRAYNFADLSSYSLKQRLLIRAADLIFYLLIRLVGRTVRFRVEGWEHWEEATRDGSLPVYTTWHEGVFLSTYFWRELRIVVMTSRSFDGEYIARFIQRLG
ncbi:MAG TPA: DUF374 domain-containing protein, partial [Pyrinomonadaceae bacterium]|nr:DUF374 domain-containing protein [Pyrinomonadaceae bacterium]